MEITLQAFSLLFLIFLFLLINSNLIEAANYNAIDADYKIKTLNRSSFPRGFLFGTASSAYQYEGGARVDGRGPSIWDTYTHKFPEWRVFQVVVCVFVFQVVDSYHRYKEDVKIMKEMGVDAYRFSFSWSRILPNGKVAKGVNKKGLAYYHNLIDELLANGIQPFVTLFHWDLPQPLQDEYGGFLSPRIVDDFQDYADLCFREFGNKVKHWMTLNEPFSYSFGVYQVGIFSSKQCPKSQPDKCTVDPATQPYLAAHYQLLAHAAAVRRYKRKYQGSQKGLIGIALNSRWYIPKTQAKHNQNAAMRALDFQFGWFMDPITYGDYPHTMRALVGDRLPKFSRVQSAMLKGSYDFLGFNYFSSSYAAYAHTFKNAKPSYNTDGLVNITNERNGVPIGPKAASYWLYVYPRGLYDLLLHIKGKYKDPVIYITENGIDEENNAKLTLQEALADSMRIQYYHGHLAFLQQAVRSAVKVRGYFAWSLLDNFEWGSGYTVRFGIHYVDYKDGLKRYPKHSAKWFKNFLRK